MDLPIKHIWVIAEVMDSTHQTDMDYCRSNGFYPSNRYGLLQIWVIAEVMDSTHQTDMGYCRSNGFYPSNRYGLLQT
jgi:hypothetical protein